MLDAARRKHCLRPLTGQAQRQRFADARESTRDDGGLISKVRSIHSTPLTEHCEEKAQEPNPLTRRSVNACEFDEGVELLGRRELRSRLGTAGLDEVEHRYIVFSPFDVAWQHRIEHYLGKVPLGAQQYVAGRRR